MIDMNGALALGYNRDVAQASAIHAERIIRDLHFLLFPEEYDSQYDSIADAADRRAGRNPMNQDYVDGVNARRMSLGFKPLDQVGLPVSNEAMKLVRTCFENKDVFCAGRTCHATF